MLIKLDPCCQKQHQHYVWVRFGGKSGWWPYTMKQEITHSYCQQKLKKGGKELMKNMKVSESLLTMGGY